MILLKREEIKKILPKVGKGLSQYLQIQDSVWKTDVSKDINFQKQFNTFYRITPFRDKKWQKSFYNLFQAGKKKGLNFQKTLRNLHKKTKRVEASFASKLTATLNPKASDN